MRASSQKTPTRSRARHEHIRDRAALGRPAPRSARSSAQGGSAPADRAGIGSACRRRCVRLLLRHRSRERRGGRTSRSTRRPACRLRGADPSSAGERAPDCDLRAGASSPSPQPPSEKRSPSRTDSGSARTGGHARGVERACRHADAHSDTDAHADARAIGSSSERARTVRPFQPFLRLGRRILARWWRHVRKLGLS